MANRNIVVIGASAGGFDVIRKIVAVLPADLNASILIVWHLSPDVRGILPQILNQAGTLQASNGIDFEPLQPGHIYVAPPDHHLLIEGDHTRISRGPKENRFRPAIDPLFRSAAFHHGKRVIGVILSGGLDDGSAGLWTIKKHGGVAIVQDPAEAEVRSMPQNAIEVAAPDHVVSAAEIGPLLVQLVNEQVRETDEPITQTDRTKQEIDIAMDREEQKLSVYTEGTLTPFTCPDCHGVLSSIVEAGRTRFRCHTGHAFSADTLLAGITEHTEQSLWIAIRSTQEGVMLLNSMGDHFADANQPKIAASFFKKALEAEKRLAILKSAVLDNELLSTDLIRSRAGEK
jgi:two-component system chemotaxis response regulator CheB